MASWSNPRGQPPPASAVLVALVSDVLSLLQLNNKAEIASRVSNFFIYSALIYPMFKQMRKYSVDVFYKNDIFEGNIDEIDEYTAISIHFGGSTAQAL
jgi:hypothetical protein